MSEAVVDAIPLGDEETVTWTGRPRRTVVLPAVVVGAALLCVGGAAVWVGRLPLGAALAALGLGIPFARDLRNRRTQYVVSDRALYVTGGVVTRSVARAALDTVQNSAYAQDVTGSLFGYGSVEFEVAGGGDLAFRAIDRPRDVRALVDRATGDDGITGSRSKSASIPGSLAQWRRIRDEVRAVRRSLERRE
jgi:hypothetical protein